MATLADAFNTGISAINNMQQGRNLAVQAQYAPAMAAENLYTAHTTNQYLPDKLRLANQYQSLINQYYGPDILSQINQRNTETKFTPLKYAIEAENSVRNNSRFGDASNLIRSVNGMKNSDQEIWKSDPNNLASYNDAINQVGAGLKSSKSTILTPQFLKQFGLASGMTDVGNSPMQSAPPAPQQNAQPAGLGAPMMPPQNNQPSPPPPPAVDQPQQPQQSPAGLAAPITPMPDKVIPPEATANQEPVHPMVKQAVAQHIADNAPNQDLPLPQRQALAYQSLANQKVAGAKLWNRAQGAITLENLIQGNADQTSKRIENATQYATAAGQGQYAIDRLLNSNKEAYTDYKWFKQDFVPNLGNNIKVMEQLASTDSQREALGEMFTNSIKWDTNPKTASKLINMSIGLLHDQAKATLKSAQPVNPGVLEKLNGLKNENGDYIGSSKSKYSDDELAKMAQAAIAKGADPKAVQKRMEELKNG